MAVVVARLAVVVTALAVEATWVSDGRLRQKACERKH